MTDVLESRDEGRVRVLILNRPDQLNAFNQLLCDALADALIVANADDNIHVVVVTGAGRAFSAGTDLFELANAGDFRGGPNSKHGFEGMTDIVTTFTKPLLCAVNGVAVGIGATILGLCDLALMASSARIRCPFTSLGLVPEAASSFTFPLIAGRQAATWALLSSAWLSAEEALQAGLVWRVTTSETLLAETMVAANQLASHPLQSLIESKRLIAAGFADGVVAARCRENEAFDRLLASPDHRRAVEAFVESR